MSTTPNENRPDQELVSDIQRRQRNTTWPDVMTNASSADALMWRGSRRITKVQRVGVGLFGLFFLLAGVSFASDSIRNGWWLELVISAAFSLVGLKLIWNSIRKNEPQQLEPKDHQQALSNADQNPNPSETL
jgi:hypothetical protein